MSMIERPSTPTSATPMVFECPGAPRANRIIIGQSECDQINQSDAIREILSIAGVSATVKYLCRKDVDNFSKLNAVVEIVGRLKFGRQEPSIMPRVIQASQRILVTLFNNDVDAHSAMFQLFRGEGNLESLVIRLADRIVYYRPRIRR